MSRWSASAGHALLSKRVRATTTKMMINLAKLRTRFPGLQQMDRTRRRVPAPPSRATRLKLAMRGIRDAECILSAAIIDALRQIKGVSIFGLASKDRLEERVPTFGITVEGMHPKEVARRLAGEGIWVWNGNYYALEPMVRLGLEEGGGGVRISLVHYNTLDEISRLARALESLCV